jgi:dTDP-L-rhamnose 4-epimerase
VRVLDTLEAQVHGRGSGRPEYLNPGAELIEGSVLDPEMISAALEGIDVVFHEAALVGVGQSMYEIARYCEANTLGTAVLLEALVARRDQVRKVIVASSMSIYGEGAYASSAGFTAPRVRTREALASGEWEFRDPTSGELLQPIPTPESKPLHPGSVYAVTKRDHEELCLAVGYAYGIPTVALRYFNIYGTRQALSNPYTGVAAIFSSRLLNGNAPVVFEDGGQTRDFVHVSDIVQANLLAMERTEADFEAVNVGTGAPTSVLQVGQELIRLLGPDGIEPEIVGKFREGDSRHCFADISKARDLLGYDPHVEFSAGLVELVEWVQSESAVDRFDEAHAELATRGLA